MNTFAWLLKREYWEHRGGFLRAPIIAGGIVLLLTAMMFAVLMRHAGGIINSIHVSEISSHMTPDQLAKLGMGLDATLLGPCCFVAVALFFVLFFYCLGSLYDERRDRSILFWKSLPISDVETVLSKVATAALVAPLIAVAVAVAGMIGMMLLLSIVFAAYGLNPITTIWMTTSPLTIAVKLALTIPINAIWALPTIGWLMLCSAFAKRVAFLWAIFVPVGAGLLVSWTSMMQTVSLPDTYFWKHVVGRLLLSVAPGSWLDLNNIRSFRRGGDPTEMANVFSFSAMGDVLASPETWIGAVAGAAMIAAAVWMRRWRDDS